MENKGILEKKAKLFALEIIKKFNEQANKNCLFNQLLRSATSIGANLIEANYGVSKADFISKMHISAKECAETKYWLELLTEANLIDKKENDLICKCDELLRMITASLNTAKKI
ncbi:MAG: four helix bundle protein [Clostridiales bacterium]|nr:four helix bundle protein [Clostridiales bacterium]